MSRLKTLSIIKFFNSNGRIPQPQSDTTLENTRLCQARTFDKMVRLFYPIFSDTLEQIAGGMDGNNDTNPAQQWIQTFKENKRWVTILSMVRTICS